MLASTADANPRLRRKRRLVISSEGLKTQGSQKKRSNSPTIGSDQNRRRLIKGAHLDIQAFVSLSRAVMARICQYLHPVELLALSRTCKLLRAVFMSKQSKPCWDESRLQLGIPDWRQVASPKAMAFIYEHSCQGMGCEEPTRLRCVYLCRKYCARCGRENLLDVKEVRREWPDLPEDLVTRLPWTPKRPGTSAKDVRKGRFYLKEDVVNLSRHFQQLTDQPSWIIGAFRAELIAKQRQRAAVAVEIRMWFDRTTKRQEGEFKERWVMISAVMVSRWGWTAVPYGDLPGRLKQIVDYLINLPDLPEDIWDRVRGDLTRAIGEKAPGRDQHERPFYLRGAALSEREPASSK